MAFSLLIIVLQFHSVFLFYFSAMYKCRSDFWFSELTLMLFHYVPAGVKTEIQGSKSAFSQGLALSPNYKDFFFFCHLFNCL